MNNKHLPKEQPDQQDVEFRRQWHAGVTAAAYRLFRENFGHGLDETFSAETRARIFEQGSLRDFAVAAFSCRQPVELDYFRIPTLNEGVYFDSSAGSQRFNYKGELFEFTQAIMLDGPGDYALGFHLIWQPKGAQMEVVELDNYLTGDEVHALLEAHEHEFWTSDYNTSWHSLVKALLDRFFEEKACSTFREAPGFPPRT